MHLKSVSLFFILFALLLSPAVSISAETPSPLPVTVGIAPLKYFVERIGGNLVTVTVLLPSGADPHTYEPKPGQILALNRARLLITAGVPFELIWMKRFTSVNSRLNVVAADRGIQKIPMKESGHHAEHNHQPDESDPHSWLSPIEAGRMADTIHQALSEADPAHREQYAANHRRFRNEIDSLHAELTRLFSDVSGSRFLVFHPSWGYFARDYGLEQIAVEIDGREPRPAELIETIRSAKKLGIKAVFVQPQMSKRSASTIASAIGGRIVTADPLAESWTANLRKVAAQFKDAMK